MVSSNSAQPIKRQPKRRWWRYFVQFSLRSLLIVTTLAAVACWWFLRPQTQHEELAGKFLKLRRQVRLDPIQPPGHFIVSSPPGKAPVNLNKIRWEQAVNVGRWELRNQRDDMLVVGHYENDRREGIWITYHANGRKAAAGNVVHGAKDGMWRTWNDEGQLVSEVNYVATEPQPRMMGGFGRGGKLETREAAAARPWDSRRHGSSKAWHANGRLKAEGSYQNNLREGLWTFYNELGQVTAKGEYRRDKRERHWTVLDTAKGESQEVEFVAGRRAE